jgi:hypothetical protein
MTVLETNWIIKEIFSNEAITRKMPDKTIIHGRRRSAA